MQAIELAGQERLKTQRDIRSGLARFVEEADLRLYQFEMIATGKQPERPERKLPEPTGDATLDEHHQRIYEMQIQSDKERALPWLELAEDWLERVRRFLGYVDPSEKAMFDQLRHVEPQAAPPFDHPEHLAEWWEGIRIRQERLMAMWERYREF